MPLLQALNAVNYIFFYNCFFYGESISSQRIEAWWSILFVNLREIIFRNRSELQYNM
jgi:hypothetical protein